MYQYKISVVIPIYNVELFLKSCLDSVVAQTLKDIEILCINDGSTDNSGAILDEYARNDDRIVAIHQVNQGVGLTRNKAIEIARGEFLCFMDPDDFYPDSDILEDMYNQAKLHNTKICGGCFLHYNSVKEEFYKVEIPSLSGYFFDKREIVSYRDYQFDYGFHRFIYQVSFLRENNLSFPALSRFQDPPFFVKAMFLAQEFYALNRTTYAYRVNHSKPTWNEKKVVDLVSGLSMNLRLSRKHNLNKLKEYTVSRTYDHLRMLKSRSTDLRNLMLKECLKQDKYLSLILRKEFYAIFLKDRHQRLLKSIFSIRNSENKKHKVVTIFGMRFSLRRKNRVSN